jgi:hypothetical protein
MKYKQLSINNTEEFRSKLEWPLYWNLHFKLEEELKSSLFSRISCKIYYKLCTASIKLIKLNEIFTS